MSETTTETNHADEADRLLKRAGEETFDAAYLTTMQAQARASLAVAAAQDRYGLMVQAFIDRMPPLDEPEQPKPTEPAPSEPAVSS